MRTKLIVVAALGATLIVAVGVAFAGSSSDVTTAKQATATFKSLATAKVAGYTVKLKTTPSNGSKACISSPTDGGMGVHMVNASLLNDSIDLKAPEALVYEPRGNGALKLVALEYVVDKKAWHGAGHVNAPKLFGQEFSLVTKNPFGLKPFYALHAWVWKTNKSGIFAPWNPGVSCP